MCQSMDAGWQEENNRNRKFGTVMAKTRRILKLEQDNKFRARH